MRRSRTPRGNFTADLPIALWILFMILFFPLVDMATVFLRFGFLYMAAHNATLAAARARSFQTPVAGQSSATQIAQNTVTTVSNAWAGIHVTQVTTSIVITNVTSHAITTQTAPLATAPDDTNNTYQVQVAVTADVDPFVKFNMPWFGKMPGLTAAITDTQNDRAYFENTQGLTL